MSCMDNPHTFLSQLRDHNLISDDRYKKVSRIRSKDNMKRALYEVLDWLEEERSQHIKVFWKCVFKDTIMNQYPTLLMLRKSLMDGSFHFDTQLPEKVEKEGTDRKKSKEPSEDEGKEKQVGSVKKKRKQSRSDLEEEQPGPSSQLTSDPKKRSKKISFSSPVKKGEKSDIWTWAIYKSQLPVNCGAQKGMLNRDRLAKGEKCILVNKQWFTPSEFERLAGKKSCKNWKLSIRCMNTPLLTLIQEGHLKSTRYKGGCKKAKKLQFPSDTFIIVSEGTEDEDNEDQESSSEKEASPDVTDEEGETEEQPGSQQFKVTCGPVAGTLHKKRFASGTCGKSIRTETSWMSPVGFMKEAKMQTDASWKKDILWEDKPLSVLIELGDYTTVIKTPMWLGNVADKLQKNHYKTVGEFASDVELIFTNCASYNRCNAEFFDMGVRLKELFDGEFKKVFNIHEDAD
ncbi:hypothetical protein PAMP_009456 [Pampus punctatissimus]